LYHADDSANVFTNDPRGLNLPYRSKHFRPEVAVIARSFPSSCAAERLAWESSSKDVNPSSPFFEICFLDISITYTFRKVILQYLLTKIVNLAPELVAPAHPFRSEVTCPYAGE
jgi:hypothetical protein